MPAGTRERSGMNSEIIYNQAKENQMSTLAKKIFHKQRHMYSTEYNIKIILI